MKDEVYDFYFSAELLKDLEDSACTSKEKYIYAYFDGKGFTEAISSGKTPISNNRKDNVKVGTGTQKQVTYK